MKRSRWTTEEQRKQIGAAMAIATTANLLLGLRYAETGRAYVDSMVTHGGLDRDLCDGGTRYILIPMLPFAVELCLKGIKSQGMREFLWTHNLQSLWTDLDAVEQMGIRKRVESPAWRNEAMRRRDALDITGKVRTIDQVIKVHQDDFERWRYVVDGERNLTEEGARVSIDEAIMDLYGIVFACVEYHQARDAQYR
ncbi:MAG: hypothetical protein OXT71_01960 [Acidobacteriota bacterium]|nr:hypothetical protein [Acidobacteriota bacterium]